MIRVATNIPEAFHRRAEYVFRFFSLLWGVPVIVSRDPLQTGRPDIFYSANHRHEEQGTVYIPFNERLYDAECPCDTLQHESLSLWSAAGGGLDSFDVIASSYRLLTFLDEQQVRPGERDRRGTFTTQALAAPRRRTAHLPVVDHHARYLLQRLNESRSALPLTTIPKWPGGKRYVVALTHDTDAIALGATGELVTNFSKFLVRRDRTFLRMFAGGLRHIGNPTADPFFGFPLWKEFESFRRLRSCFYLFAKVVPLKKDINNCKSSVVEQPIDWDILRRMADDNWEFGFHAPIDPENKLESFVEGKRWIEKKLGIPIQGLRHHYWALDWRRPHLTFRKHIDAGFRYDTSIAWKDVAGFRAATCHPFRPFDPEWDKPLDIYEIPACLMDGHVLGNLDGTASPVEAGLEIIRRVKEQGGVAVLDWHTETACDAYNYKNYLTTLGRILEPLLEDDDVWFATPWEIAEHWHKRSIELKAL